MGDQRWSSRWMTFGEGYRHHASWSMLLDHTAQSTVVCPRHCGQRMPWRAQSGTDLYPHATHVLDPVTRGAHVRLVPGTMEEEHDEHHTLWDHRRDQRAADHVE